jgi:hypothetical protein
LKNRDCTKKRQSKDHATKRWIEWKGNEAKSKGCFAWAIDSTKEKKSQNKAKKETQIPGILALHQSSSGQCENTN